MRAYNSALNQEVQKMLITARMVDNSIEFDTPDGGQISVHKEISMINAINILRERAEGIVADRRKVIDMSVGTDACYIGLMRP